MEKVCYAVTRSTWLNTFGSIWSQQWQILVKCMSNQQRISLINHDYKINLVEYIGSMWSQRWQISVKSTSNQQRINLINHDLTILNTELKKNRPPISPFEIMYLFCSLSLRMRI